MVLHRIFHFIHYLFSILGHIYYATLPIHIQIAANILCSVDMPLLAIHFHFILFIFVYYLSMRLEFIVTIFF